MLLFIKCKRDVACLLLLTWSPNHDVFTGRRGQSRQCHGGPVCPLKGLAWYQVAYCIKVDSLLSHSVFIPMKNHLCFAPGDRGLLTWPNLPLWQLEHLKCTWIRRCTAKIAHNDFMTGLVLTFHYKIWCENLLNQNDPEDTKRWHTGLDSIFISINHCRRKVLVKLVN